MLVRPSDTRPFYVLVATPSGAKGKGGVDRVMALLQAQLAVEGRADLHVKFVPTRGDGSVVLSPLYALAFCVQMIWARLLGHIHVLHINLASDGSSLRKLMISRCARLISIPYVIHLHGAEYERYWEGANPVLSWLIRRMFEQAAQVIVLGHVWQAFVETKAPGARDKITVIPNAASTPVVAQHRNSGQVRMLFLGRIGDRKGVPQLLDALARLEANHNWRATIAGDGDVGQARKTVSLLGLTDRVSLPGWVGPDEVARLLASSDILVLPSFAENLPMSVIEAMAAGLAIVATPVGAVADIIIDNETGMLVPPGDVSALAAALAKLVDDEGLRQRLRRGAVALHREKLDVAPFALAIVETWRRAAKNGRVARGVPATAPFVRGHGE